MTLSWLLISISQYLSLIMSFATLVKDFDFLSTICFDMLQTETVSLFMVFYEKLYNSLKNCAWRSDVVYLPYMFSVVQLVSD